MRSLFQPRPVATDTTVDRLNARLRAGEPVQVVDVREAAEWAGGHIPQATHIPLGQLQRRLSELDRDRLIVTVCRSGNRSAHAAVALQQAGFNAVENLDGGMVAWSRARLPIER
jgi:rhodanese-related sulfurtransferase